MQFKKIVVLGLVLLLVSIPVFALESNTGDASEVPTEETEEITIVAEVEGQEISSKDLEEYANLEQIVMQVAQTDQEFAQVLFSTEEGQEVLEEYQKMKLDELINEKLLLNEVEESGVTVTEAEVDEIFDDHIEMVKEENDLTEDELLDALAQQGISSLDEYKELVIDEENLLIEIFLQEEILTEEDLDDTEIQEALDSYLSELREEANVSIYL